MRMHVSRPVSTRGWGWLALGLTTLALVALLFLAARTAGAAEGASADAAAPSGLTIVVMDPLALPLSCPCVKGYAQRDYDKLAARLQAALHRPVRVVFNESLTTALAGDAGQADLVIGKHSVVLADAARSHLKLTPVASLSGKDGATTQTGLIVVPKDDPAQAASDLKGYRIIFGPAECDEKNAAAVALLRRSGVDVPATLETSPACSDGACEILEAAKKDSNKRGAAVISSYAKPLLEGCGTVEKGDLRVVAETDPVPFVEAFVNEQLPPDQRSALIAAVLQSTSDPLLRIAIESRDGFVPLDREPSPRAMSPAASASAADAKKK